MDAKIILGLKTSKNAISDLNELSLLLENHIRKEERQLFQKIQKYFSEELDGLDGRIPSAKNSCKI